MNISLVDIVDIAFSALQWLLYARIILSFLPLFMRVDPYHPIIRFVYETTEPLMAPFRRILPPVGGFDFSIILLFLVIQFLRGQIIELLIRAGLG